MTEQAKEANIRLLPGIDRPDKTLDEQPIADIIEKLELALALAKDGKVRALGIAWATPDGRTTQAFSEGDQGHRLMASIAYLMHRFAAYQLEYNTPSTDVPTGESA